MVLPPGGLSLISSGKLGSLIGQADFGSVGARSSRLGLLDSWGPLGGDHHHHRRKWRHPGCFLVSLSCLCPLHITHSFPKALYTPPGQAWTPPDPCRQAWRCRPRVPGRPEH